MKIKTTVVIVLLAAFLITAIFFMSTSKPLKMHQHVRIAIPGFQSTALVILAQAKGFFSEQALDVDLEFRSTGFECLQMVIQGTADLAVAFETPITHASTAGHQLAVLSEIHHSELNTVIVARKGVGTTQASDLVGKKIGFVPKTNAEFLLELFFNAHLLDLKKSTLKEYSIVNLVAALLSGEIDAAALWEPYVSKVMNEHPLKFSLLRTSYYTEFSMIVGLRDSVDAHRDTSEGVVKALLQAQRYYDANTIEAQAIVDKVLISHSYFVSPQPWRQMSVQVGLSRTLLTMLNEESKWSQAKMGSENSIDMKTTLYSRFLKAQEPERVTFE